MNAKALLLTASLVALGAFSALPTSAAFARNLDVSVDRADGGGDKVSADKNGSKDASADRNSKDGQGDVVGSNDIGNSTRHQASAKAAKSRNADGLADKNGGDVASPDKNNAKDSTGDANSSKDGNGDSKGSHDSAKGGKGGAGHNHR